MKLQTIRDEKRGGYTLRLMRDASGRFIGVVLPPSGGRLGPFEGSDEAESWRRLEEEAVKAGKAYIGFDGARARFLRFFSKGFADPRYLEKERDYKVEAKRQLDAAAPLAVVARGAGHGEAILAAFRKTDLLHPMEKARLQSLLRGSSSEDFVKAAAAFAQHGGASALEGMRRTLAPHMSGKWPAATYLPFLWRPDAHMFLKPEVTQDFAARVGHPFAHAYASDLEVTVYESLLDLAARTETELVSLAPRDRIDVQSFIWVVGSYRDEDLSA